MTQRPLAPPDIPIPAGEDEALLAQYEAWQQERAGSLPEFIVWRWLVYDKKQKEGLDFIFQWALFGGRTAFGGFVLDFWFPDRNEGWRVMGLRYHLLAPRSRALDQVSRMMLMSRGINVVDLWEDDILERTEYALNLAWRGREVSPGRAAA